MSGSYKDTVVCRGVLYWLHGYIILLLRRDSKGESGGLWGRVGWSQDTGRVTTIPHPVTVYIGGPMKGYI